MNLGIQVAFTLYTIRDEMNSCGHPLNLGVVGLKETTHSVRCQVVCVCARVRACLRVSE